MFRSIVIGVDGRDGGEDALRLARRLAAPDGNLIAASVAVGLDGLPAAEAAAKAVAAEAPEARTEIVLSSGVAAGLHETARSHGADLIVVGSCHRGPLGRILAGDDAARTIRDAPCAVAIAPAGHAAEGPLATIGVGYDRRPESLAALDVARAVAAAAGARVKALHVVAVGTWVTPPNAYSGSAIDEEVREAQRRLDELEGVEGLAVVGFPGDDLARFAEDLDALVVGTHHRSAAGRVLLGSTAEHLAARCTVPLIVVPRQHTGNGAEAEREHATTT